MSLLERIRTALAPDITIEEEIAAGGMGVVYRAHDRRLDRIVALKVMRPEMLTAEAALRFQREARILATLKHPGVVKVYSAGVADGLNYYLMEYVDCPTLADRIAEGRLPAAELTQLALSLLDALAAAHEAGVIHRDIKPANVFCCPDQSVLSDFGISLIDSSADTTLTKPEVAIGTPRYMSPEQLRGARASKATDIYSLGMCLYEAATGQVWDRDAGVAGNDWTSVPRSVSQALRKALEDEPQNRWQTPREFSGSISGRGIQPLNLKLIGGVTVLALVVSAVAFLTSRDDGPAMFTAERCRTTDDPSAATALAQGVQDAVSHVFPWLVTNPEVAEPGDGGNRNVLRCELSRRQQGWRVIPTMADSSGSVRPGGSILVDSISHAISPLTSFVLASYFDNIVPFHDLQCPDSIPAAALAEWVAGELNFARDDWSLAVARYDAALALDPSFATARWRRFIATRWARRAVRQANIADLTNSPCLSDLDRELVAAVITEPLDQRISRYRTVFERWRERSYAALFYGNELFHRGPLAGVSLERSIQVLEEIRQPDRVLAPAENQIIWGYIRLGDQESAARALQRRLESSVDPLATTGVSLEDTGDPDAMSLLQLAFSERFYPNGPALDTLKTFLSDPTAKMATDVATTLRLSLSLDIPHVQVTLGEMIANHPDAPIGTKVNGIVAAALGHLMMGQPTVFLEQLAEAYALSQDDELLLFMSEAPVLLRFFGIEFPDSVTQQSRVTLAAMAGGPQPRWRASWALVMDATGTANAPGRPVAGGDFLDRLPSNRARAAAIAYQLAESGRLPDALAASRTAAGLEETPEDSDPYSRALIKWGRASWLEALAQQAAHNEWLWYQNTDFANWPEGSTIQAAEIDWALSTYARVNQAKNQLNLGSAGRATGCRNLNRVLELWQDSGPLVAAIKQQADSLSRTACQ